MLFWQILFWTCCFIVFYNYAGYPVLLLIINKFRKKPRAKDDPAFFPSVSFIVAAYNEEDCIEKKILNSLKQDYPSDKIEFIFITDGSTDKTMEIILQYGSVRLLHLDQRQGKSAALNRAVKAARNEVLIFSDANTLLNTQATRKITRHYADPKVGGVAGEKKVLTVDGGRDEVGASEGLYWKYESYLKQLDSDFYSVVGAAGELFSLRKSLFEPVGDQVILDDFVISMKVTLRGSRIVYEPKAYAMELPSFSMGDEQKRKVRIAAGGFQAMSILGLAPFLLKPRLFFLYFSHRVLRWTLSPLSLLLAFVANLVLVLSTESYAYKAIFALQAIFYTMALVAGIVTTRNPFFKLFKLCYYFVFMNVSVVQGFFRFLRGRQPSAWEKARRSQAVSPRQD
jgi:poly-beta-1,6-N-acetyl-D-glucosamine synthase